MKRLLRKILSVLNKVVLIISSLKKIYRYGGYTAVEIASVNHGKILDGKRVLITGGSSGIGLSIAKKCIQEGAKVVITGRDEKKLQFAESEINNPLIKTLVWDISQITEIKIGIANAEKLLDGEIDILINNAGVLLKGQSFPNVDEDAWDNTYAINSKGLFFLTQEISKKWLVNNKNQIKKIINISSQGAFVGATYPYRMTKWDVAGLTQGLGIKLAPHGIIVNGIAPGIVLTSMQPSFIEQRENVYSSINPVERVALPEEIAELAIFLMSNAANFIVGQTIVCDGGFSLK